MEMLCITYINELSHVCKTGNKATYNNYGSKYH